MSSIAPAAAMAWPVIDFVELTGIPGAASPSALCSATVSARSFSSVEVPCALT